MCGGENEWSKFSNTRDSHCPPPLFPGLACGQAREQRGVQFKSPRWGVLPPLINGAIPAAYPE